MQLSEQHIKIKLKYCRTILDQAERELLADFTTDAIQHLEEVKEEIQCIIDTINI
jgi:hypothetical protein